jgi:hypothetical protein
MQHINSGLDLGSRLCCVGVVRPSAQQLAQSEDLKSSLHSVRPREWEPSGLALNPHTQMGANEVQQKNRCTRQVNGVMCAHMNSQLAFSYTCTQKRLHLRLRLRLRFESLGSRGHR